jgi:hypothetical protein
MKQDGCLTVEERARITEIQDSLIERYVKQKEAIREENRCRAKELEFEIRELLREKDKINHWAVLRSAGAAIGPVRALGKLSKARV